MSPKRSQNPAEVPGEPSSPENTDPGLSEVEIDAYERLEALRTDAEGAGWTIWIDKRAADGVTWSRCRRFPFDGFDLDVIPRTFGAGEYRLAISDDRNRYVRRGIRVSFAAEAWPVTPTPPGPIADAMRQLPSSETERLRQRIEEQDREHRRFLETILTALLTRGVNQQGTSLKELIEAQKELRDLTNPQGKSPEMSALIEAVRLGRDLTNGNAPGEEGKGDLLDKVLERVPALMDRLSVQRPVLVAPGNGAARPAPPTQVAGKIPNGGPGNSPIPQAIQPYLFLRKFSTTLLGWALEGFNPRRVASGFFEVVPQESLTALDDFVHLPAAQRHSILCQIDPRLAPYEPYLASVAEELALLIDEDQDTEFGGPSDDAKPGDQGTTQ